MKPTRALAALLGLAVVLLLAAGPAGAHGGEGQVEVSSITRAGDAVTVVARLTYVEDGHGVPDATVTVVVDDGTPVPMEPGAEEGDYQVTVPAPEGATIRVTSVEPATTVETTAPAAEETTTTGEASTTTTAAETTTTDAGPTTPTNEEGVAVPGPDGIDEAPDDETGSVILIAVLAVLAIAAVVVAVIVFVVKKPSSDDDPSTEAGS
ncbi:MAG TPA: hypothetical protein VF228_04160 [Iamia sp.]